NQLSDYGISDEKWERYSKNEKQFSFGNIKLFPQHDADAAVFLTGLNDLDNLNNSYDTPRIRDRQWWITLKRKLEGELISQNPLFIPKIINSDSSFLLNDTIISSSEYDKEKIEKIRTMCRQWAEKSGVSHVTLVVHKGKIIFNEAFGLNDDGKPLDKYSKMWMASITKLLTGALMMQFVDQGIIDLDAPVNRYLPEIKGSGNDKLTVRHLFTHTSGLQFAGEWASDWNYSLENQIDQLLPSVNVGESFAYHRVGYALAGKIMERVTGRSIPYLFYNYLFIPLGMTSAFSDNTYGGLYCSSIDLARFGQMLLNQGTYNNFRFFSEQTFEKMLPRKLPISDRLWGIGTTPMQGNGLSELSFGHAAASGTVFRIDPKNDLIIISSRNKTGKSHDEFESALIESCTALVNKH
ncbi:MAG: class A beta-lactamase-related serine hydrolase, partial [Ignavibacteriales bacterium]